MTDILAEICAEKRAHVARAKAAFPEAALLAALVEAPPLRPFAVALERRLAEGRYGLIAEIKKASPSAGLIRSDFDPPALARAYAAGGAPPWAAKMRRTDSMVSASPAGLSSR